MNPLIIAFIAFDMVVTVLVVLWVVRRRAGGPMGVLGVDFAAVRQFSDKAQPLASEYMRANYSGDPESLPSVLSGLLDRLQSEAQVMKLPLDRDVLRSVLKQLVAGQKLASGSEIARAMKKVA